MIYVETLLDSLGIVVRATTLLTALDKASHKLILRNVDMPAIIITQCPVDFEDFAAIGVKTSRVMPPDDKIQTKGEIVEIVTGVVRGVTVDQAKLDEIVSKVQSMLPDRNGREPQ